MSDDTDPATFAVEAEFPRWRCWRGISGLLYASRQRTSPPLVLRGKDPDGLLAQIRAAEDKIASEYTFRYPRNAP